MLSRTAEEQGQRRTKSMGCTGRGERNLLRKRPAFMGKEETARHDGRNETQERVVDG